MHALYDDIVKLANQHFSPQERAQLLALPWVGSIVIERLEEVGFYKLQQLKDEDPFEIILLISEKLKSTCWRNSPQARKAIQAVVDHANGFS